MTDIILKEESYKIIGICMKVHSNLGMGFKEAVYKDAVEIEFRSQGVHFVKEKQFQQVALSIILLLRPSII